MPNGGRRPGAGRKSKAEEAGLQKLLEDAWTPTERKAVIKEMVKEAKAGNVKAATLLMNYAYGKPPVRVEIEGGEKPLQIQIVEVAPLRKRTDSAD